METQIISNNEKYYQLWNIKNVIDLNYNKKIKTEKIKFGDYKIYFQFEKNKDVFGGSDLISISIINGSWKHILLRPVSLKINDSNVTMRNRNFEEYSKYDGITLKVNDLKKQDLKIELEFEIKKKETIITKLLEKKFPINLNNT